MFHGVGDIWQHGALGNSISMLLRSQRHALVFKIIILRLFEVALQVIPCFIDWGIFAPFLVFFVENSGPMKGEEHRVKYLLIQDGAVSGVSIFHALLNVCKK